MIDHSAKIFKQAFVISMDENRLKQFYQQSDSEIFKYFPAVVGKDILAEELAKEFHLERSVEIYTRRLSLGEIGCTLSHYKIYKTIIEDISIDDQDFILIAEDDALFDEKWLEKLTQFKDIIQSINDIAIVNLSNVYNINFSRFTRREILGFKKHIGTNIKLADQNYSLHPVHTIMGSGSALYMIRKSICRNLISVKPYWLADDFGFNLISYTNYYVLEPNIAIQNPEIDSQIVLGREESRKESMVQNYSVYDRKNKIYEIMNLILRNLYLKFKIKNIVKKK